MFGYVTANLKELDKDQLHRFNAVYCGICRQLRLRASQVSRLSLSYDMTFLALLLMSLYEPEEDSGDRACLLHPLRPKPWVDNPYIRYSADMNVALAYFSCLDHWADDKNLAAKAMASQLHKHCQPVQAAYPRQWQAIETCLSRLSQLERENCASIDETAGYFGALMAELMVYEEDLWAPTLRQLGLHLGRFIYMADAAADFDADKKKKKYNPFLAGGTEKNWPLWEEYLVLALGKCTEAFEKLPLVQDKPLLDNILYSGVWTNFRQKAGKAK